MAKIATLCMTTLFLLLLTFSWAHARREPVFHDVTPMETHQGENEEQQVDVDHLDRCEGLGEDECMTRNTLEANLDYIYTQKQKQP